MKKIVVLILVVAMLFSAAMAEGNQQRLATGKLPTRLGEKSGDSSGMELHYKSSGHIMLLSTPTENTYESFLPELIDFELTLQGDHDTESIVLDIGGNIDPIKFEVLLEQGRHVLNALITVSQKEMEASYRITLDSSDVFRIYSVNADVEVCKYEFSLQEMNKYSLENIVNYGIKVLGSQNALTPLINKFIAFDGQPGDKLTIHVRELVIPFVQMMNDPDMQQTIESTAEKSGLLKYRIINNLFEEIKATFYYMDIEAIEGAQGAFELSVLEDGKWLLEYFSDGSVDNSKMKYSLSGDEAGLNLQVYAQTQQEGEYEHVGRAEFTRENGLHFLVESYLNGESFIYLDVVNGPIISTKAMQLQGRLVYKVSTYDDIAIALWNLECDTDAKSGMSQIEASYKFERADGSGIVFTLEMDQTF